MQVLFIYSHWVNGKLVNSAQYLDCINVQISIQFQYWFIRGFIWGQRPAIFANHWTANDLKVAGHKSITICFFLSEIIFREKMVSLSNNDRFDDAKIFHCKVWHFSIITGIYCVSIFFVFILNIFIVFTPAHILYWYKYTKWQEMKNYVNFFFKKNYF